MMNKYIDLQHHYLISSYGGIGSLIETNIGSLLISDFESWTFYNQVIKDADADELSEKSISDRRLLNRLKRTFPKIEYLVAIPTNTTEKSGWKATNQKNIITAEYFPHWFFCPRCRLFKNISDWYQLWRDDKLGEFNLLCPNCYKKIKNNKPIRVSLEQVRFIQVSESGDIRDFPWVEWFNSKNNNNSNCENHNLSYKTAFFSEDLDAIFISCSKCGKSYSLTGIFEQDRLEDYKTVLRSSNSVYFPAIIRSLVISEPLSHQDITEIDYRCEEVDFIMNAEYSADNVFNNDLLHLSLKNMGSNNEVYQVISIRELSMVSVLCSYSRLSPIRVGRPYEDDRSCYVTKSKRYSIYLPAIRSSGEGFLLYFDDIIISEWYSNAINNESFKHRLKSLEDSLQDNKLLEDFIEKGYALAKYIMLHTVSHLLIKQLEYISGYPATSIFERIYASSKHHAAIMIYTIAGAEGSYGGIVTQVEKEKGKIPHILKKALQEGKNCSADPVCYASESVCFACCLLPETSCEVYNKLLDRRFVFDDDYGFQNYIKLDA